MKSKDTFCSCCGCIFNSKEYPKVCLGCDYIAYNNPLPVTATAIMVKDDKKWGVVVVKRNIEPKKGQWALPGGFLENGETWSEGTAREVFEETGLDLDSNEFEIETLATASNGNLIIFSSYHFPYLNLEDIKFAANEEVSEIKIIFSPEELAFPTHTEVIKVLLGTYNAMAIL